MAHACAERPRPSLKTAAMACWHELLRAEPCHSFEQWRRPGSARTLGYMALIAIDEGDFASARRELEQTVDLMRRVGSGYDTAIGLYSLGCVELIDGDARRAAELAKQAIDLAEAHDLPRIAMESKVLLGRSYIDAGDGEQARTLLRGAIDDVAAVDKPAETIHGLGAASEYAVFVARSPRDGLLLLGASDSLRDELGMPLGAPDVIRRTRTLDAIRSADPTLDLDDGISKGRMVSLDVAVQAAVRLLAPPPSSEHS